MWVSEFWTNDIVYMIIHTISMSMVCLSKYGQKVDLMNYELSVLRIAMQCLEINLNDATLMMIE